MNPLVVIYKKARIHAFNQRHHTKIRSLYASLYAHYGIDVRIDPHTRVASNVTIGDYSYVNQNSALQNCDIGKFCSISSGVNISPYNHNMSGLTTHPVGDFDRQLKRVVIGNDVLISLNVTIIEGVHIGDGAIIGAGAIVTHDIGNYEVWGGVPARHIHYRVEDPALRGLLSNLKWWDLDAGKRQYYIDQYRTSLDGLLNEDTQDK